jgi:hypothetical protein
MPPFSFLRNKPMQHWELNCIYSVTLSCTFVWSFIDTPQQVLDLQPWKWHSVRGWCQCGTESMPPLTLRTTLERCRNLRHIFKKFNLTCKNFSPTWQCEALRKCRNDCRFTILVSMCWTNHHTNYTWFHPTFISSQNWRNISDRITSCQMISQSQQ